MGSGRGQRGEAGAAGDDRVRPEGGGLDVEQLPSSSSLDQETARELVRAREDCRGDLMRAQHRLSKLLLRHGIVYYGGDAWTGRHDQWLRSEALPQLTSRPTRLTFDADRETVRASKARRDRLDVAIEEMAAGSELTPVVRRLGCLRWGERPDRVRTCGPDRRLAPVHRHHHRLLRRAHPNELLLGWITLARPDRQDWQRPRPPPAARGRVAPPTPLPDRDDHA